MSIEKEPASERPKLRLKTGAGGGAPAPSTPPPAPPPAGEAVAGKPSASAAKLKTPPPTGTRSEGARPPFRVGGGESGEAASAGKPLTRPPMAPGEAPRQTPPPPPPPPAAKRETVGEVAVPPPAPAAAPRPDPRANKSRGSPPPVSGVGGKAAGAPPPVQGTPANQGKKPPKAPAAGKSGGSSALKIAAMLALVMAVIGGGGYGIYALASLALGDGGEATQASAGGTGTPEGGPEEAAAPVRLPKPGKTMPKSVIERAKAVSEQMNAANQEVYQAMAEQDVSGSSQLIVEELEPSKPVVVEAAPGGGDGSGDLGAFLEAVGIEPPAQPGEAAAERGGAARTAPAGARPVVQDKAAEPDDAAYAWLNAQHVFGLNASASPPKLIMGNRTFLLGDTVNREYGLRFVDVRTRERLIVFRDEAGAAYFKSY